MGTIAGTMSGAFQGSGGSVPFGLPWDAERATAGLLEPSNSVAPSISGTVGTIGATLTTTNGTWLGIPTPVTFTYQWTRDGVNIAAATASTYVQVKNDIGPAIRCVVTATNGVGLGIAAASNALAYVPTADVIDWLDPATLAPGAVTTWPGVSSVWSPTEATNKPVASQTSLGGKPGVTGNGTNQKLAASINLSGGTSCRIVAAMLDATATVAGVAGNGTLTAGTFQFFVNDSLGGNVSSYIKGATGLGEGQTAAASVPLTTATVVAFCPDTTAAIGSAFIRANGTSLSLTSIVSLADSNALANASLSLFTGSETVPTFWPGTYGVVAIMSGNAQDAALDRVERFIAYRAGIAVW